MWPVQRRCAESARFWMFGGGEPFTAGGSFLQHSSDGSSIKLGRLGTPLPSRAVGATGKCRPSDSWYLLGGPVAWQHDSGYIFSNFLPHRDLRFVGN